LDELKRVVFEHKAGRTVADIRFTLSLDFTSIDKLEHIQTALGEDTTVEQAKAEKRSFAVLSFNVPGSKFTGTMTLTEFHFDDQHKVVAGQAPSKNKKKKRRQYGVPVDTIFGLTLEELLEEPSVVNMETGEVVVPD
jgi:hypothetical protein